MGVLVSLQDLVTLYQATKISTEWNTTSISIHWATLDNLLFNLSIVAFLDIKGG